MYKATFCLSFSSRLKNCYGTVALGAPEIVHEASMFVLRLRPFIHGGKDQHKSCIAHHGDPLLCPCLRTTYYFFLVIFLGWVKLLNPQATSTDHGVSAKFYVKSFLIRSKIPNLLFKFYA